MAESDTRSGRSREQILEAALRDIADNYEGIIGASLLAKKALFEAARAPVSEQQPSVAVADMEIIGHREPGDAHKGRAWWSGGTWLQPGEVVAVLTLPKQDERNEQ